MFRKHNIDNLRSMITIGSNNQITYPGGQRRSGSCGERQKPVAERRGRRESAVNRHHPSSQHLNSMAIDIFNIKQQQQEQLTEALRDWDIIAARLVVNKTLQRGEE